MDTLGALSQQQQDQLVTKEIRKGAPIPTIGKVTPIALLIIELLFGGSVQLRFKYTFEAKTENRIFSFKCHYRNHGISNPLQKEFLLPQIFGCVIL